MTLVGLTPRSCTTCKGTGISKGWTSNDGKHVIPERPCFACEGKGTFEPPEWLKLFEMVTKPGKDGKRSFRKSKPSFENEYKNRIEGRAYFIWRMCRFHGGADVTMPVCATSAIHGDPFFDEMDAFASYLAAKVFGTDKAAAYRWMNALGYDVKVPSNQPASAFSCGPVADSHKPEQELPELC